MLTASGGINTFKIPQSPRLFFENILDRRDDIKVSHDHNKHIIEVDTPRSNGLYVLEYDNPFDIVVVKRKGSRKILLMEMYDLVHLRNSLIRHVLTLDSDLAIDQAIFILYYYWYINSTTASNITNNVIIEMREIISTIIKKETGVYAHYDTDSAIRKMREKLKLENLAKEGQLHQSLSFRRF
jgi:hypothetical protein